MYTTVPGHGDASAPIRMWADPESVEPQALEQLQGLRMAFERRRVMPFEVAATLLVRDTSQANVREPPSTFGSRMV